MECSESMKACLYSTSMFCKREYQIGKIIIQQNDKSTQLYQRKYGQEALNQLQLWEKDTIRLSDYKNPKIFTLRCISKNLVPVSIKLKPDKSKLSQGARKVIEKAEKQLLQDRVRCINKAIEDKDNINNNKTRLASMVTNAEDLEKCSKLIEEVNVVRFNKVKDRQVRKFTNLLARNRALDNNRHVNLARQDNNASRGNRQANNTGKNNTNNNNTSNNNGSSNNRDNQAYDKWVINLSKQKLTQAQISVLAKGPNFSIASNNIPNLDYITAVETMCGKLKEEDAMALRTDINALLRKAKIPKSNLTKEERIGLTQLKKDQDRVVLTADKEIALMVMDKQEYISKAEALLAQPAYKTIPRDPTNKIKAQLITKLRRIKRENNLDEGMYKAMYPTGCVPPKFYGLPKIHKTGNPLRPIISSRGSVTYGVAKVISKVFKPLVGKSPPSCTKYR